MRLLAITRTIRWLLIAMRHDLLVIFLEYPALTRLTFDTRNIHRSRTPPEGMNPVEPAL